MTFKKDIIKNLEAENSKLETRLKKAKEAFMREKKNREMAERLKGIFEFKAFKLEQENAELKQRNAELQSAIIEIKAAITLNNGHEEV